MNVKSKPNYREKLPETQAIVIPPNSLSENLNKKVPHWQVDNISSACFFLTNPIMALKINNSYIDKNKLNTTHIQHPQIKKQVSFFVINDSIKILHVQFMYIFNFLLLTKIVQ